MLRDKTQSMRQAKSLPAWNIKSSRVDKHRLVNEHVANWEDSFQGPLVCPFPPPNHSHLHLYQKPGVTQLGLPKTFCPFPQGSNQSLTDGCVGQEIVSLAKASWLRETFFAVGVPKGRRGPDNIRIHLYSPPFMPWFTSLSPLQALSETSPRGSQSLHKNPQAFLPGHLGRVRR